MTDFETRLKELEEEMDVLRRTGEELEFALEAVEHLAALIIPLIDREYLVPLTTALKRFFEEWEFTRHPRGLLIERTLRTWLDLLESAARFADPDGLARSNRAALYDVLRAHRENAVAELSVEAERHEKSADSGGQSAASPHEQFDVSSSPGESQEDRKD